MDFMVISPWESDVSAASPDGSMTSHLQNAVEVGQGGPVRGTLVLSTGLMVDDCNGSMVWSVDSRYLAVPRWEATAQRLVVIDTHTGRLRASCRLYRVLELMSFHGGVVSGIDSPMHLPVAVAVDIATKFEKPVPEEWVFKGVLGRGIAWIAEFFY